MNRRSGDLDGSSLVKYLYSRTKAVPGELDTDCYVWQGSRDYRDRKDGSRYLRYGLTRYKRSLGSVIGLYGSYIKALFQKTWK